MSIDGIVITNLIKEIVEINGLDKKVVYYNQNTVLGNLRPKDVEIVAIIKREIKEVLV